MPNFRVTAEKSVGRFPQRNHSQDRCTAYKNRPLSFNKPFHRNYRPVLKTGAQAGYSDWAYIIDREYCNNPEHYTRAFLIIQEDLKKLFEFVEPSDNNCSTYSFRIHELLMRTCIEVETNFKAILKENIFNPIFNSGSRQG